MDIGIGVDAHKDELAAAAVDALGRVVAEITFRNDPGGHTTFVEWLGELGGRRRVGIEGAGNYAWQLAGRLQQAGEDVREVPGHLTRRERRHQRRRGKSDPMDAVAIARVVLRENRLPPVGVLARRTICGSSWAIGTPSSANAPAPPISCTRISVPCSPDTGAR